MSKKEKEQTITIDDKEYLIDELSPESIQLVNHVSDLDNKLRNATFNVEQLQGGRNYFMELLKGSLNESDK